LRKAPQAIGVGKEPAVKSEPRRFLDPSWPFGSPWDGNGLT